MSSIDPGLLAELAVLTLYAVVAATFTITGLAVEYVSLQYLGGGETAVALWLAAFGAIMLYVGLYGIGYRRVLARRG